MTKGKVFIVTTVIDGKKLTHLQDLTLVRTIQVKEGEGIVLDFGDSSLTINGDPIKLLSAIDKDWAKTVTKGWEEIDKEDEMITSFSN